MFDHLTANRFNIVLACRQSGKSIAVVAYLLWYAIFKGEQVVGVLANKNAIAREMLSTYYTDAREPTILFTTRMYCTQ